MLWLSKIFKINLNNMKQIISILSFLIIFNYANTQELCQPDKNKCIDDTINFTDGSQVKVKYCGDLNFSRKEYDGCGILYYDDYVIESKEGTWKNSRLNGFGEVKFSEGSIYKGYFENDKLISGSYFYENEDKSIKYIGNFNGYAFQGNGNLIIEYPDQIITQEGEFISDKFANGIEKIKFKNNGIVQKNEYANGIKTIIFRNDINQFNPSDIEGDKKFIEVDLMQKGSKYDARIAFYVNLEISGIEGEFLLDTGAMSFKIGRYMFENLKKEGVKYTDLNQIVSSFGVGGDSNSKLVVLDEVEIGDYKLKNVVASVSLDHDFSLLGTGFFLKFSNVEWHMTDKKLILYK